jgi:hypothetical protein
MSCDDAEAYEEASAEWRHADRLDAFSYTFLAFSQGMVDAEARRRRLLPEYQQRLLLSVDRDTFEAMIAIPDRTPRVPERLTPEVLRQRIIDVQGHPLPEALDEEEIAAGVWNQLRELRDRLAPPPKEAEAPDTRPRRPCLQCGSPAELPGDDYCDRWPYCTPPFDPSGLPRMGRCHAH